MVGKPRSCTACRQAKVACDARSRAPNVCTRCAEKQLQCRLDFNFKRVSTRQITRDITNELHLLRASQNPGLSKVKTDAPQAPKAQDPFGEHLENKVVFLLSTSVDDCALFTVGTVSVPSASIVDLFQHFEQFYLAHAPFLQPIGSLSRLCAKNPLLFWTIVLIASGNHPVYHILYARLILPHKSLLAPISNTAVQTVEDIHAILILCLWPVVTERPHDDPSWSYISIATNYCLRLGFFRPTINRGNPGNALAASVMSVQARYSTLLACFNIGTHVAMFLGFVPLFTSNHQLRQIKQVLDQPGAHASNQLKLMTTVYQIVCNYSASLEDVQDSETKSRLAQGFDDALDHMKQQHSRHWTCETEILFQYAKLNLCCMAITLPVQDLFRLDALFFIEKQSQVARGLSSAMSIIRHMKSMDHSPLIEIGIETPRLVYLPRVFFIALFFSAVFLFRMVVNNRNAVEADRVGALEGLVEAERIFARFPHHRDATRAALQTKDLVTKARKVMESNETVFPMDLMVTDCLGASLLWDTVFRCHWTEDGGTGGASNYPPHDDSGTKHLPTAPGSTSTTSLPELPGSLAQSPNSGIWNDSEDSQNMSHYFYQ